MSLAMTWCNARSMQRVPKAERYLIRSRLCRKKYFDAMGSITNKIAKQSRRVPSFFHLRIKSRVDSQPTHVDRSGRIFSVSHFLPSYQCSPLSRYRRSMRFHMRFAGSSSLTCLQPNDGQWQTLNQRVFTITASHARISSLRECRSLGS